MNQMYGTILRSHLLLKRRGRVSSSLSHITLSKEERFFWVVLDGDAVGSGGEAGATDGGVVKR